MLRLTHLFIAKRSVSYFTKPKITALLLSGTSSMLFLNTGFVYGTIMNDI